MIAMYLISDEMKENALARTRTIHARNSEFRSMAWEDCYSHIFNTKTRHEELMTQNALLDQKRTLENLNKNTDVEKWEHAAEHGFYEYLAAFLKPLKSTETMQWVNSRATISGKTSLEQACSLGDPKMTELLVEKGGDPFLQTEDGRTAVHFAAESGNLQVLNCLIRHTPETPLDEICSPFSYYMTLHHLAARGGHVQLLDFLLLQAPEEIEAVTVGDMDFITPLHYAIGKGSYSCMELLLQKGAKVETETRSHGNAIHVALRQPFRVNSLLSLLMDYIQDNETSFSLRNDENGMSIFQLAVFYNFTDVAISMLHRFGADTVQVDLYTKGGAGAIHLATQNGNLAIILELLKYGATIDLTDNAGQSPLLVACLKPNFDVLKALIFKGSDLKHQDRHGHTALHMMASYSSDIKALCLLLSGGAAVDSRTRHFNTPLHLAALSGNHIASEMLIRYGADVNAINADKISVLSLAQKWKCQPMVDNILQVRRQNKVNREDRIISSLELQVIQSRASFRDVTKSGMDTSRSSVVSTKCNMPTMSSTKVLGMTNTRSVGLTPFQKLQIQRKEASKQQLNTEVQYRPTLRVSTCLPSAPFHRPGLSPQQIAWKETLPVGRYSMQRTLKPILQPLPKW